MSGTNQANQLLKIDRGLKIRVVIHFCRWQIHMTIKSDNTLSEGTREWVDETHQYLMSKPRHTTSTVCK